MKAIFRELLQHSEDYTMAVADSMPVKLDDFKPANDVWTFRQQLHHIAYGISWWTGNFISGHKTEWNPPVTGKNRKETIGYLQKSYNEWKDAIKEANVTDEVIKGFFATLDHVTHHRGQLIIYLRCNGIAAPEYSF
jgi:uncharacterized damage-inducible protein DinB